MVYNKISAILTELNQMDKIFLRGMKAKTLIGVYEWERQHPQTLVLDLEIGVNQFALASDNINETVHYGVVCEVVRAHLQTRSFMLLETLAQDIADLLFARFDGIVQLDIRVVKQGILPHVDEVGVAIQRFKTP